MRAMPRWTNDGKKNTSSYIGNGCDEKVKAVICLKIDVVLPYREDCKDTKNTQRST